MSLNLPAIRASTEALARHTAPLLLDYMNRPELGIATKTGGYDIVTEADKAAEQVIVAALLDAYPDHHIEGEEGGGLGANVETAEYVWYIDPIDGTTNYASRIPHFAISIALTTQTMEPLVGVVYNPATDEMFSASKGGGATLNGQPMAVSRTVDLASSVIGTGFPYDRATNPHNNVAEWLYFLPRTRDLRRFGSAALDLTYVAAGRFDGFWEMHLNPWDYMAGVLCVLEAGGIVTDYRGRSHDGTAQGEAPVHGQLLAANPHIHALMLEGLSGVNSS